MKNSKMLTVVVLVLGLMVWLTGSLEAAPMGTAWTYQGRLMDANGPADGLYDFQFKLFDDANVIDGNQVGGDVNVPDVDVIDGYFTVELNFGGIVFDGDARWLQILVRPGDGSEPNDFVTLTPRQELTPTPYAIYAGTDNDWMISGDDMYSIPAGNVGIGTSTPKKNLTIQATRPRLALVENGGDAGVLEFHQQENQLRLQYWTDYGITFHTNMMTLDGDTGNVGIGTITPGAKLDVEVTSGPAATIGSSTNSAVGDYAVAMGSDTTADGKNSTAMGYGSIARGWNSVAMGEFTTTYGDNSLAMGYYTDANGWNSTAMGRETTASGITSTAMGRETTASNYYSTAMGYRTTSSGDYSTAMGRETTASGESSTAMGNETTASGDSSTAMGVNATANGWNSTAMGRETTASGITSTAMGYSTDANGHYSTAMGNSTDASGESSTAMGRYTTASGYASTAMGNSTDASGDSSTAMGVNATSSGSGSTAMGLNTTASGITSTAMGRETTASGYASTVMGNGTTAIGQYSTAMGWNTTAIGGSSTAMGNGTTASGGASTAMGCGIEAAGDYSVAIALGDLAGTVVTRSNIMAIMGGKVSIGELNPSRRFFVNGDAGGTTGWYNDSDLRLKKDIVTIDNALEKVNKLRGVEFEWKDTDNHVEGRQIGFIGQETVEVVPEVVDIKDGHYSMQYAPLTALLVEAVKELQSKNDELQEQNNRLESRLSELENAMRNGSLIGKEL